MTGPLPDMKPSAHTALHSEDVVDAFVAVILAHVLLAAAWLAARAVFALVA